MYRGDPLNSLIQNRSLYEKPLTSNEERANEFFIMDEKSRDQRIKQKSMTDMDNFSGIININEIKRDKDYILKLRKQPEQKDFTERANIFQNIINNLNEVKFFGENSHITPTLEYDDRINHTDFILEFKNRNDIIRLAVDVTLAEDKSVIEKKMMNIIHDLNSNNLTTIKYFQSFFDKNTKGTQTGIPRVILAMEKDKLDDLCENFIDYKKNNKTSFKNYYIQIFFLELIKQQLDSIMIGIENGKFPIAKKDKFASMKKNIKQCQEVINKTIANKKSSLDTKSTQRAAREISTSMLFPELKFN